MASKQAKRKRITREQRRRKLRQRLRAVEKAVEADSRKIGSGGRIGKFGD